MVIFNSYVGLPEGISHLMSLQGVSNAFFPIFEFFEFVEAVMTFS